MQVPDRYEKIDYKTGECPTKESSMDRSDEQESSVFEILRNNMKEDSKIIYRITFTTEENQVLESINKHSSFRIDDKINTQSMGNTLSLLLKHNK